MDNSEVKQIMHGIWMGIAEISCEAAVVHPLFGIVGLVMKALSSAVDKNEDKKVKKDLNELLPKIEQILYENKKTLNQIKKISVILQNDEIVKNIKYQFKTFQYMYEAEEKYKMDEADNFIRMFKECNRSMNLDSLYDSVMWENKIFGQPILEVYKTCSGNDPVVMKKLCTFLQCLFAEGLIALVAFKYVTNDNVDKCVEEWKEKIENVDRKLAEVLNESQFRQ
ncbi:protein rapunzel-like [Erpetoichthys calabaricus]|uniref:protein rapunzel-like n=1 Tax=Erpetoichthys calabaricus TaxID=27687 RepID=UPI0010A0740A|nr:protein rapunzel-like [Erpetoichthys calabaricus]XP_051778786.1 protein rapunzel-like [Erpetoichthys calabaricus]